MDTNHFELLQALPPSLSAKEKLPAFVLRLMGCRTFNQFCCSLRAEVDSERFCPFCQRELQRRGRRPEVKLGEWMLIENEFPHKHTERMRLIVPTKHRTQLNRLNGADWEAIGKLISHCSTESTGGGVLLRYGAPHQNSGTIEHLHFNIVVPVFGREYRPPFAKDLREHEGDYERLSGFRSRLIARGGREWLFSPDGIDETQPKLKAR